jgi:hypothetical protein
MTSFMLLLGRHCSLSTAEHTMPRDGPPSSTRSAVRLPLVILKTWVNFISTVALPCNNISVQLSLSSMSRRVSIALPCGRIISHLVITETHTSPIDALELMDRLIDRMKVLRIDCMLIIM